MSEQPAHNLEDQVADSADPVGTLAWLLAKHPLAGAHISMERETRDRWVADYGACSVHPLGILPADRKPFAWRYRLKGNMTWHFYEGATFDLAEPEAYEYAPLFL